jgi:hypothetical protein
VGLGDATAIDTISILWPGDRTPQGITGVEPGAFWRITQGSAQAARLSVPKLPIGTARAAAKP